MQVPNQQKRKLILEAAARLFASRPFHKVRLEDIAAAARVAKGTVYVYFSSKEELLLAMTFQAFSRMVDHVRQHLDTDARPKSAAEEAGQLDQVVSRLVDFSYESPDFYELTRMIGRLSGKERRNWDSKRRELSDLLERAIRAGVRSGEFDDPQPAVTAVCILGMVRALMLFGPRGLDQRAAAGQICRLVRQGISAPVHRRSTQGIHHDASRRRTSAHLPPAPAAR